MPAISEKTRGAQEDENGGGGGGGGGGSGVSLRSTGGKSSGYRSKLHNGQERRRVKRGSVRQARWQTKAGEEEAD